MVMVLCIKDFVSGFKEDGKRYLHLESLRNNWLVIKGNAKLIELGYHLLENGLFLFYQSKLKHQRLILR